MRVSREVAAKHRETVVENASRAFRENGYDGIGVAALMKSAGLTHGGFYKQFDSKEALAVEATAAALVANQARWAAAFAEAKGDPLAVLATWYLTPAHVDRREEGCTFAALAAEAPRHGPEMSAVFAAALERWIEVIDEAAAGEPPSRCAVLQSLSTMVGALILARAVPDGALREEVLACARGPHPPLPDDGSGPTGSS